jgi:hypothetical protein
MKQKRIFVCFIVLAICLLTACNKGSEKLPNVWVNDNNDPIYMEISSNGDYVKYKESTGKEQPLDEGMWIQENNDITLYKRIAENEISPVGLTLPYIIKTIDNNIILKIGKDDSLYFTGTLEVDNEIK